MRIRGENVDRVREICKTTKGEADERTLTWKKIDGWQDGTAKRLMCMGREQVCKKQKK